MAEVQLVLTGLAPGLERRARVWRVDHENGNAFASWQAMGSPARPTKRQINRLVAQARMTAVPLRVGPRGSDGSVSLDLRLPLQSVELIELGVR
jgi:xylan 1,4-beta-xylosidase